MKPSKNDTGALYLGPDAKAHNFVLWGPQESVP